MKNGTKRDLAILVGFALFGFVAFTNLEVGDMIARDELRLVPEKTAVAGLHVPAAASTMTSTSVSPEELDSKMVSPRTGKPIEIIEVDAKTTYTGGPVAYVDYSRDDFGDCVAVWYPDGRFSHCDDALRGWQTMFPRAVPAGTTYSQISLRWDEEFAPRNWY